MTTKLTYSEQLRHPNWQRRRLEIMSRDGYRCQLCDDADTTLHVHHKHYIKGRMAWEYSDDELVTLCYPCHENEHEQSDAIKMLLASLEMDGPYSVPEAIGLIAGWANQRYGRDLSEYKAHSPYMFAAGESLVHPIVGGV